MATEVTDRPIGETRTLSTADGGTALSTTLALIPIPPRVSRLIIIPRNFATAVVAKFALNPYLVVLKTLDNLATATDYSEAAQDADTATDIDLSSLDTAANGDYLYVGSHQRFRGVRVDVDAANGNASTLTVNYWNGTAWVTITATDGSASGGATIAVDGNVTWTVPAAWVAASLEDIASPVPGSIVPYKDLKLYWTRWQVSAALDATSTLNSMLSLNRNTAQYAELLATTALDERIKRGLGGIACVEALTDGGTANLIVNGVMSAEEFYA